MKKEVHPALSSDLILPKQQDKVQVKGNWVTMMPGAPEIMLPFSLDPNFFTHYEICILELGNSLRAGVR